MWHEAYEQFFKAAGTSAEQELRLVRLEPTARVFGVNESFDLVPSEEAMANTYEHLETGAGERFREYLADGRRKYRLAQEYFLESNFNSKIEAFLSSFIFKLGPGVLWGSMERELAKRFKHPLVEAAIMLPGAFLGAPPGRTSSLFTLMNSIETDGGVSHPMGGMYTIVEALVRLGKAAGVEYRIDMPVVKIQTAGGRTTGVVLGSGERHNADLVVAANDRAFIERNLLEPREREFPESYWASREKTFSCLLLYLGVRGKLERLTHHNVFFAQNWKKHFEEIEAGVLPSDPNIFVDMPSATDPSVAPEGSENLFVLIPIAPREYETGELEMYGDRIIDKLAALFGEPDLGERIVVRRQFGGADFSHTYNAFGNTAFGVSHSLFQSAWWRPNNVHSKIKNLFFVGASTNPGIGVPTCLLSAIRVARRIGLQK